MVKHLPPAVKHLPPAVKHLPPAVKQLLTLRNPQPRPAPPLSRLNAVLASTFQDAKAKKAERGWLTLATCTLLTANAPPTIGHLYRFTTRSDPDHAETRRGLAEALDKAALMRESALKSCIFVGVPRTILSLASLHEAIEDDVRQGLRKTSKRTVTTENVEEIVARGQALWASIYEPHAEKLYNKLGSYHPDFIICCRAMKLLEHVPGRRISCMRLESLARRCKPCLPNMCLYCNIWSRESVLEMTQEPDIVPITLLSSENGGCRDTQVLRRLGLGYLLRPLLLWTMLYTKRLAETSGLRAGTPALAHFASVN